MNFVDEAIIEFASGHGGSGAVSFHREKFVPLGGPNGSDGGRGGDVILIADKGKRTLFDIQLLHRIEAAPGTHAVGNKRGKNGRYTEVRLPVGTQVFRNDTGELIVDLNRDGMKFTVCEGGKGGKGNLHYANSVRQAPNFAQKGAPAEVIEARLELKLLADVGLIGLPNAGKSTLISAISKARPKIGDYPFTTIVPNLGVVLVRDQSFVVADMPGLIEGASEGIGLGHQFLKHVERARVLVHVVDAKPVDETDPFLNFQTVESELQKYSAELFARPRIIAINKIDLLTAEERAEITGKFAGTGFPTYAISGAASIGLTELLDFLLDEVVRTANEAAITSNVLNLDPVARKDTEWDVIVSEGNFEVVGARILRLVSMTDLNNSEALRYMHRRLDRIGVIKKLRDLGAVAGSVVSIGDIEFEFEDFE